MDKAQVSSYWVGIGNGNVDRKENVNWMVLCYASYNGHKTILVLLCTSKLQDCLEMEKLSTRQLLLQMDG